MLPLPKSMGPPWLRLLLNLMIFLKVMARLDTNHTSKCDSVILSEAKNLKNIKRSFTSLGMTELRSDSNYQHPDFCSFLALKLNITNCQISKISSKLDFDKVIFSYPNIILFFDLFAKDCKSSKGENLKPSFNA